MLLRGNKKASFLGLYPKGQFSEIRYISKEVYRISAFVDTNAVLVKKNRQTCGGTKKAPSGRELPTESGEGERVTISLI